jgi:hypothetical protein
MIKKIFLAVILFFSFNIGFSQLNQVSWQSEPLSIDGASFDWGKSFRYFDSKTRIRYNISNDSNYIYYCFQPVDEYVKAQILRAGIETTFYPKVKPKRTGIIKYPLPLEKPDGKQTMAEADNFEAFFTSFKLFNKTFNSEGFLTKNGTFPLENETGISAKLDRETNGLLCYEIKIPISELYGENYNLEEISKEDLKVKLKVNQIVVKTKNKDNQNQGGMYSQGGQYGNNYSGSYSQRNQYSNQYQGQQNSFTIQGKTLVYKMKLANKPE